MASMPLLELCVRRAGGGLTDVRKGSRACTLVVEYALFMASEGRDPRNVEEVAVYFHHSAAHAWRQLRLFRDLFPEYPDPVELAREVLRVTPSPVDAAAAQFAPVSLPAAA